jgi:hypothetical protein
MKTQREIRKNYSPEETLLVDCYSPTTGMMRFRNLPPFLWGFLTVLIVLGGMLLLFLPQDRDIPPNEAPTRTIQPPSSSPDDQPKAESDQRSGRSAEPLSVEPISPGEEIISEILLIETEDHSVIVERLFEAIDSLPPDEQEEAAYHIANLAEDTQAQAWANQIVENSLPPPAAVILYEELLNRPHAILLPTLASIADRPGHPFGEESSDMLEVLMDPKPDGLPWQSWVANQLAEENQP